MFWGRTRAVLVAIVALLGYYGVVAAAAVPLQLAMPQRWFELPHGLGVGRVPLILTALGANWVLVRRGWSTWRTLGWGGAAWRLVRWWIGAAGLGIVLASGSLALILGGGGGRVWMSGESFGAYVVGALALAAILVTAALSEELLFRGYPLARLSRASGRAPASAALAVVFVLVHLINPEVSALGLLNIGLASLLLSAAFFTRGGLPAAWGLHFGWNAGLILGADAPVSGIQFELPGVEYGAGAPAWLSGGTFGPEGGIAASLALSIGLVLLIRIIRRESEVATQ